MIAAVSLSSKDAAMNPDTSAFTLIAELQAKPGLGDALQREL